MNVSSRDIVLKNVLVLGISPKVVKYLVTGWTWAHPTRPGLVPASQPLETASHSTAASVIRVKRERCSPRRTDLDYSLTTLGFMSRLAWLRGFVCLLACYQKNPELRKLKNNIIMRTLGIFEVCKFHFYRYLADRVLFSNCTHFKKQKWVQLLDSTLSARYP